MAQRCFAVAVAVAGAGAGAVIVVVVVVVVGFGGDLVASEDLYFAGLPMRVSSRPIQVW